jgi:hypothetical protein
MIKNVYEILKEFEGVETRQQRKQILEQNNIYYFTDVLKYTFNPKYQFYIDSFPTDYIKPDTFPGIRLAGLESEIRKIYLFLKGDPTADSLTTEKRNVLLLQLLESFEPEEAVVFVNMMKKDLQTKGLTESIVREVFPDLLN